MGYLCDFCGEQRSIVYCRSDAANLCLSCDRNVHSANLLSKRHLRTLVCERCNSQPALVRCIQEKISLCQNCDWTVHAGSDVISHSHQKQPIDCYTGCPSAADISKMWSFLLDVPSVGDSTCEQRMGSMFITNDSPIILAENKSTVGIDSFNPLHNMDQVLLSGGKGPDVCEDSFYDDFNIDEVDLSIENYEELFGVSVDDGIDGIFGTRDVSGSQGAYAEEGSSIGAVNAMQPACSNAASADSVISCKTEPTLCFARQPYSGISFSGITGESSAGDHQDCGASQMVGEPPWHPPAGPEISVRSTSRSDAVMRYKEKKKARKYASRKERADVRRRVKGRFVKAGETYDYDPLIPTRSF